LGETSDEQRARAALYGKPMPQSTRNFLAGACGASYRRSTKGSR
jgi:hypothetical protein